MIEQIPKPERLDQDNHPPRMVHLEAYFDAPNALCGYVFPPDKTVALRGSLECVVCADLDGWKPA